MVSVILIISALCLYTLPVLCVFFCFLFFGHVNLFLHCVFVNLHQMLSPPFYRLHLVCTIRLSCLPGSDAIFPWSSMWSHRLARLFSEARRLGTKAARGQNYGSARFCRSTGVRNRWLSTAPATQECSWVLHQDHFRKLTKAYLQNVRRGNCLISE